MVPPPEGATLSRSSTTPVSLNLLQAGVGLRPHLLLTREQLDSRRSDCRSWRARSWWEASEANCRSRRCAPNTRSAERTSRPGPGRSPDPRRSAASGGLLPPFGPSSQVDERGRDAWSTREPQRRPRARVPVSTRTEDDRADDDDRSPLSGGAQRAGRSRRHPAAVPADDGRTPPTSSSSWRNAAWHASQPPISSSRAAWEPVTPPGRPSRSAPADAQEAPSSGPAEAQAAPHRHRAYDAARSRI